MTVREYIRLVVRGLLSVTLTVMLKGLPDAVVGVPEIPPVLAFRINPVGRPAADHVYGPTPPAAVMVVAGYTRPITPTGSDAGAVIVSA